MGRDLYISFVVVGRNDNYGGDFLHRINLFVKVLLTLCEIHSLNSELIIVEWNPPEDRPLLKDAITWPDVLGRHICVRIIQVPKHIHESLPNPAGLFLFEYLGKNVGVRRARGEYVLATNPDVIFSEELIKFIAQRRLSDRCFYRIDRCDVRTPVPADSLQAILEHCSSNIFRICTMLGTYQIGQKPSVYRRIRHLLGYIKNYPLRPAHVNASGDFFLMCREAWELLRGYPELEKRGKSHQIDGLIVYMAQLRKLRQAIIGNPLRLYHQDHGRPDNGKPRSAAVDAAYKQLKSGKLNLFNDEHWGLGKDVLPETII